MLKYLNIYILHNPMFFVFIILALGMWLGSIKLRGLSLGAAGVLFVAILFGHFYPEMVRDMPVKPAQVQTISVRGAAPATPPVVSKADADRAAQLAAAPKAVAAVSDLGLVLFAFGIGLQAGPRFFRLFQRKGIQFLVAGMATALTAGIAAVIVARLFHYSGALSLGLYTGALNCTPALAGAADTARRVGMDDSLVSAGYGLAYPFAAFFVVLFVQVLPRLLKVSPEAAARRAREDEAHAAVRIERRVVQITNPLHADKTVASLIAESATQANISRMRRDGVVRSVKPGTLLKMNDLLMAVGTLDEIDKLRSLGDFVDDEMETPGGDLASEELIVSRKEVFGKPLESLQCWEEFHVVITRARREGMEVVPTPGLLLEPGDVLRAVGHTADVEALACAVGREERRLDETMLLPFVMGVAVGVALGKLPIPLPGGLIVSLGMAGGPFLVALILGHLGRIGPISVYVPNAAKYLARDLGLILFLAGTGARAGARFFQVLALHGPMVLVAGAIISLVAVATSFVLTYKVMRWNMLSSAGGLSAVMFNPPALAAANELTHSSAPSLGFASVYPIAMISTIAAAQILVLVLKLLHML